MEVRHCLPTGCCFSGFDHVKSYCQGWIRRFTSFAARSSGNAVKSDKAAIRLKPQVVEQPPLWCTTSLVGCRSKQEDRHAQAVNDHFSVFGVFDGHMGDTAAQYCAQRLCTDVLQKLDAMSIRNALTDTFEDIESHFREMREGSGCTVVVAVVPRVGGSLTLATLGDAKAIVIAPGGAQAGAPGAQIVPKASDAKIWESSSQTLLSEAARLEASNICISKDSEGTLRIVPHGLSAPGALGDYDGGVKLEGVSATPIIESIDGDFEAVLLCTDGVWDNVPVAVLTKQFRQVFSDAYHREQAGENKSLEKACCRVAEAAVRDDNATLTCVLLDKEIPKFMNFRELAEARKRLERMNQSGA